MINNDELDPHKTVFPPGDSYVTVVFSIQGAGESNQINSRLNLANFNTSAYRKKKKYESLIW